MRIVSVTATAFGALRGMRLELGERLNVVVGPNESGKSTWHAAMYAALCGFPPPGERGPSDVRFERYRRPRPGPEWTVEAEVEVEPGRHLLIQQDLLDPAAGTASELPTPPLLGGRDVTDELRRGTVLDLTHLLGLDRRSYAATAWVEQARTRTALISVDGRNDLQLAVAACIDEDRAVAAAERLDELLRRHIGEPGSGPLAQAATVAEQRRSDRDLANRLQERLGAANAALQDARAVASRERRRLEAAEAVAARRHATELREQLRRRQAGDFPGISNLRSGWPDTTPPPSTQWQAAVGTPVVAAPAPARGDAAVHHTVAEAEREVRAAEWALRHDGAQPPAEVVAKPRSDAAVEPVRRSWSRPGRGVLLGLAGGGLTLAALGLFLASQGRAVFGAVLAVVGAAVAVLGVLGIVLMAFDDAGGAGARLNAVPSLVEHAPPSTEDLQWRRDEALAWLARSLRERGYADAEAGNAEEVLERYRADCALAARPPAPPPAPATPTGPTPQELAQAELRALADEVADAEREADRLEELADPFDLKLPYHDSPANIRPAYLQAYQSVEDLEQTVAAIERDIEGYPSPKEAQAALERAQRSVQRLRRLDAVLRRARDELVRAREAKLRDIAVGIAPRLGDYLAEVTNRPHASADTLELQQQIGQSLVNRDPELGSYSTGEVTYLFTRVELGRHLTKGHPLGPLLLDDVTSSADNDRIRRIMSVLQGIARQRQVVVFAHEQAVADWARHVMPDDPYLRLHLLSAVDRPPRTVSCATDGEAATR